MSLPDLPQTGEENFDSKVRSSLNTWKDGIESKAENSHTHGAGGVVISIVADEAALGVGATDGESKITADTGHRWVWDATEEEWTDMDALEWSTPGVEFGLIGSTNATDPDKDMDFSAGVCWDTTGLVKMVFSSDKVVQLDVVLGSGNGGMSSSLINDPTPHPRANTLYYGFALSNDDGTVLSIGYDTDADAANLLADHPTYTKYYKLRYLRTDGSANIIDSVQAGPNGERITFVKASDMAVISKQAVPETYTAVSLSGWIPPPPITTLVRMGGQSASGAQHIALSFDGTNTHHSLRVNSASNGDGQYDAWDDNDGRPSMFMPIQSTSIYWGRGGAGDNTNADLRLHEVIIRRRG